MSRSKVIQKSRFSSSQNENVCPFVGLYASHLRFRVLEALWVYKAA